VLPLESAVEQPLDIMPAPVVLSGSYKRSSEIIRYCGYDYFWFESGLLGEVKHFSGHGFWTERQQLTKRSFVFVDSYVILNVCYAPRASRDEIGASRPSELTEEALPKAKDELSGLIAEIKTRAKNIAERNLQMVKLIDEYRARWRAERRGVRESD
jgi:hypothetical protein